jgi:RNA polymerase-binding transcription factor DksA
VRSAPAPKKPETKPAPVAAPKPPVKKDVKKAPTKTEKEPKAPAQPLVTQRVAPVRPMPAPVVKKQVSTLESADKLRYSDDELLEFKELIMKKLDEARKDYDLLKQTLANTDNNGTDDTSPSFKMIEDGSETLSREETAQLAARQEKFIKHLEDAQLRIRNKTYGICRVTGRLISKERLRLVPHATLSIEAKQQMNG